MNFYPIRAGSHVIELPNKKCGNLILMTLFLRLEKQSSVALFEHVLFASKNENCLKYNQVKGKSCFLKSTFSSILHIPADPQENSTYYPSVPLGHQAVVTDLGDFFHLIYR